MLPSHYAPKSRVVLAESPAEARRWPPPTRVPRCLDDEDLVHYAHTLFARLRDADDRGVHTVIAVLPPPIGLGHAIRDRLTKAAVPVR